MLVCFSRFLSVVCVVCVFVIPCCVSCCRVVVFLMFVVVGVLLLCVWSVLVCLCCCVCVPLQLQNAPTWENDIFVFSIVV